MVQIVVHFLVYSYLSACVYTCARVQTHTLSDIIELMVSLDNNISLKGGGVTVITIAK